MSLSQRCSFPLCFKACQIFFFVCGRSPAIHVFDGTICAIENVDRWRTPADEKKYLTRLKAKEK